MAIELREGTPDDVGAVLGHLRAVFGEDDGARVRDLFAHPADAARWALCWDGPELVACSTLLSHRLHLDGVELPVGQVEWVATAPGHRRRGLVREQFDHHHRVASAAGMLLTFVAGIPYLYRRFGYGYGLEAPDVVAIAHDRPGGAGDPVAVDPATGDPGAVDPGAVGPGAAGRDPGVTSGGGSGPVVRRASLADRDALVAIDARRTTPVRVVRDEARWDRRLRTTDPGVEETLLAVATDDAGREVIRGWARLQTYPADHEQYLIWGHDEDVAATRAIVAHVRRRVPEGLQLVGYGTPGPWVDVALAAGARTPYGLGYYVRVPDPVALVAAMVPVLDRRLREAGRQDSGPLDLSLYEAGLRLELADGRITEVTAAPAIEDPFDHDDVGVAPDHLPALVLGRWGAAGLAARYDDVTLGRHADLLEVLFPRLHADVADDL